MAADGSTGLLQTVQGRFPRLAWSPRANFHSSTERFIPTGINFDSSFQGACRSPKGRKRGERCQLRWKTTGVARGHGFGAGMQIARAGVIAKPGSGLQHIVERRRRKTLHVRPAREKAHVIRRDRLHHGLLQHDLGQPDAVSDAKCQ